MNADTRQANHRRLSLAHAGTIRRRVLQLFLNTLLFASLSAIHISLVFNYIPLRLIYIYIGVSGFFPGRHAARFRLFGVRILIRLKRSIFSCLYGIFSRLPITQFYLLPLFIVVLQLWEQLNFVQFIALIISPRGNLI